MIEERKNIAEKYSDLVNIENYLKVYDHLDEIVELYNSF